MEPSPDVIGKVEFGPKTSEVNGFTVAYVGICGMLVGLVLGAIVGKRP